MKTILSLYIDGEIKELAKSKGINLSRCFEEFINLEMETLKDKEKKTDKELISLLKHNLSKARAELTEKNKIIIKLKGEEVNEKWETLPNGMRVRK